MVQSRSRMELRPNRERRGDALHGDLGEVYWFAVVSPSRTPRMRFARRKRAERSADRPAASSWIALEARTNPLYPPLLSLVVNKALARAAGACHRRGGGVRRCAG